MNMCKTFWEATGLQDHGFSILMLFGTGSSNQYHAIYRLLLLLFFSTKIIIYIYMKINISQKWLDYICFLYANLAVPCQEENCLWEWECLKGRVRRSPFYIKLLTLHPSLFAIVMHSQYFLVLLIPPQKC